MADQDKIKKLAESIARIDTDESDAVGDFKPSEGIDAIMKAMQLYQEFQSALSDAYECFSDPGYSNVDKEDFGEVVDLIDEVYDMLPKGNQDLLRKLRDAENHAKAAKIDLENKE